MARASAFLTASSLLTAEVPGEFDGLVDVVAHGALLLVLADSRLAALAQRDVARPAAIWHLRAGFCQRDLLWPLPGERGQTP